MLEYFSLFKSESYFSPFLMIDFLQTISMSSSGRLLLSIVAITIGTARPAAAQQKGAEDLKSAAEALIAQRVQLYNKKDAGGIAAEFTPDAIFVELLPSLEVIRGQEEIQKHYQQLFDAGATSFDQKITQLELNGSEEGVMAGDYSVVANGKTITGYWFEILRQLAGTWKATVHVFARPNPIIEWRLEFPQARLRTQALVSLDANRPAPDSP
jgi:ketosteroid isomerase-like protein